MRTRCPLALGPTLYAVARIAPTDRDVSHAVIGLRSEFDRLPRVRIEARRRTALNFDFTAPGRHVQQFLTSTVLPGRPLTAESKLQTTRKRGQHR